MSEFDNHAANSANTLNRLGSNQISPRINHLASIDDLIDAFHQYDRMAYTKINHGFWDAIARVLNSMEWPKDESSRLRADHLADNSQGCFKELFKRLFSTNYIDEFLSLLQTAHNTSDGLFIGARIINFPVHPGVSKLSREEIKSILQKIYSDRLMKKIKNHKKLFYKENPDAHK